MATTLIGGLHKAQEVVQSTASKDKKIVDLERDTANVHTKLPMSSDHGVKINNTDHWLKIIGEDKEHRLGPLLLEDQLAREKVYIHTHLYYN